MRIYIPTLGRGLAQQRTIQALGSKIIERYRATLVAPSSECEEYDRAGLRVLPFDGPPGMGLKRQFIIEQSDDPYVFMLDDDLQHWAERVTTPDGKVRFLAITQQHERLLAHFVAFEALLQQYVHASIGFRLFAFRHPNIAYNTRMLRALGYQRDVLLQGGFTFRLPLMQDLDMQLQLLQAGYPSAHYYGVVQEQERSNAAGGCSVYRTPALMQTAAQTLAQWYPGLVKITNTQSNWGEAFAGTGQVNVKINWRNALKQSELFDHVD